MQKTALVVDDQPVVSELLAVLLHARGLEVCTAVSGPEARWILAHRSIDLLITDVCMPGMDGVALAAEFRNLSPATKVMFMSGYSADDLAAMGANISGSLLLHKPFSLRSIDTALDAMAEFDQVLA